MMLVTFTWLPPSWEAMLPQKFSAATTWIVLPPEPDDEAVEELPLVEQAVTVRATRTPTPPRANRDGRDAAGRDGTALMTRDLLNQAGPRQRDTGTPGHHPR